MKEFEIKGIKVVWLGHASFLIKASGKNIYIDPYRIKEGEKADIILITHEHFDHCDRESLKNIIKENTIVITTEYAYEKIKDIIKSYRIVNPLSGSWIIDEIEIEPFWAYNINKPFHPKGKGVGFIIKIGDIKIYHAGDTDFIPEMKNLKDITLALVPIGGTYTMDVKEAAEAVNTFKPEYVFPMHYNTFPEIRADPNEFKRLVKYSKVIE